MADTNSGGGGEGVYRIVKPIVIAGLETSYLCQLEQGGKTVKVRIRNHLLLPGCACVFFDSTTSGVRYPIQGRR